MFAENFRYPTRDVTHREREVCASAGQFRGKLIQIGGFRAGHVMASREKPAQRGGRKETKLWKCVVCSGKIRNNSEYLFRINSRMFF